MHYGARWCMQDRKQLQSPGGVADARQGSQQRWQECALAERRARCCKDRWFQTFGCNPWWLRRSSRQVQASNLAS